MWVGALLDVGVFCAPCVCTGDLNSFAFLKNGDRVWRFGPVDRRLIGRSNSVRLFFVAYFRRMVCVAELGNSGCRHEENVILIFFSTDVL